MQLTLREMLQIGKLPAESERENDGKSSGIKEKNSRRPTWFYEYGNILVLPGRGSDIASALAYGELFDSYEARGELNANKPKSDDEIVA